MSFVRVSLTGGIRSRRPQNAPDQNHRVRVELMISSRVIGRNADASRPVCDEFAAWLLTGGCEMVPAVFTFATGFAGTGAEGATGEFTGLGVATGSPNSSRRSQPKKPFES